MNDRPRLDVAAVVDFGAIGHRRVIRVIQEGTELSGNLERSASAKVSSRHDPTPRSSIDAIVLGNSFGVSQDRSMEKLPSEVMRADLRSWSALALGQASAKFC